MEPVTTQPHSLDEKTKNVNLPDSLTQLSSASEIRITQHIDPVEGMCIITQYVASNVLALPIEIRNSSLCCR